VFPGSAPGPAPGPYPGQIQPRPLNTLVAPQQPMQRAPMQVRMAGELAVAKALARREQPGW